MPTQSTHVQVQELVQVIFELFTLGIEVIKFISPLRSQDGLSPFVNAAILSEATSNPMRPSGSNLQSHLQHGDNHLPVYAIVVVNQEPSCIL